MIAAVLWGLALLVAALLLMPITVRAHGAAGEEELWGIAELSWGRGLATVRVGPEPRGRLYLLGIPVYRSGSLLDREDKDKKKKKKVAGRAGGLKRIAAVEGRVALRMASRAIRALHPCLYIGGTVGLADPGNTALMLSAVRRIDELAGERVRLDLRDDYLEDTTQLHGRMGAWIVPAELGLVLLVWMLRSDTRRVLRRT
jgi:hypothetical protein